MPCRLAIERSFCNTSIGRILGSRRSAVVTLMTPACELECSEDYCGDGCIHVLHRSDMQCLTAALFYGHVPYYANTSTCGRKRTTSALLHTQLRSSDPAHNRCHRIRFGACQTDWHITRERPTTHPVESRLIAPVRIAFLLCLPVSRLA